MQRNTKFVSNEYYHIYNRGTEKRKIFLDNSEHKRFLYLLYLANQNENVHLSNIFQNKKTNVFTLPRAEPLVSILAYCLMPNHFHILIRGEVENGVSRFMLKLQTAYSMYFNKRHERGGSLFEGPFKAEHISGENYLTYIFSYIHLNSVKLLVENWKSKNSFSKKETDSILNYPYSSLQDYLGKERPESVIVNKTNSPFEGERYTLDEIIKLWFTHRNIEK